MSLSIGVIASPVAPRLQLVQLGIGSPGAHQGGVVAGLNDAATGHHQDQVGHTHGGEAVADQQGDGAAAGGGVPGGAAEAFEQGVFGGGVQAGGGLVQDQQQWR